MTSKAFQLELEHERLRLSQRSASPCAEPAPQRTKCADAGESVLRVRTLIIHPAAGSEYK